jgi:hypothetical protein
MRILNIKHQSWKLLERKLSMKIIDGIGVRHLTFMSDIAAGR